jgi:hypothetical protein
MDSRLGLDASQPPTGGKPRAPQGMQGVTLRCRPAGDHGGGQFRKAAFKGGDQSPGHTAKLLPRVVGQDMAPRADSRLGAGLLVGQLLSRQPRPL